MDYGVQPYLSKSIEELENDDLKREIILNDDHYVFVDFCHQCSNKCIKEY